MKYVFRNHKSIFNIILSVIIFMCAIALVNAEDNSGQWIVPLSPSLWKACPEAVSNDQLYRAMSGLEGKMKEGVGSKLTSGYDIKALENGTEFTILGNVIDRRSMMWSTDVGQSDMSGYDYVIIRYKAEGIARDTSPLQLIYVSGKNASGQDVNLPLLDSSQFIGDGKWHSILWKKKSDIKAEKINVKVYTENSSAYLVIGAIEFYKQLPSVGIVFESGWNNLRLSDNDFECVNLANQFNYTYAQAFQRALNVSAAVDGIDNIPSGAVSVDGIPFKMGSESGNLIHPDESNSWKNETVELRGVKVPRTSWRTIQRDDKINVEVGKKVSEAYLVLINEFPVSRGVYSLPALPYTIKDIEGFTIELQYADGDNDLAFPYSIADKSFLLRRMFGTYVIPVDSSRILKRIVVKNRNYGVSVNVAAVTLNTSKNRMFANLWADQKPAKIAKNAAPVGNKAGISLKDNILTVSNPFGSMVIDCRNGLSINSCTNLWAKKSPIVFDKESGLEVMVGNDILAGTSFKTENVSVNGRTANIELISQKESVPIRLRIKVSVDNSEEIHFKVSATNTGNVDINPQVRFPVLKDIKIVDHNDTWYMFPQFRNVNSNQNGYCRHIQDRAFPMQFFDVYNPTAGSGITFMTHNLIFAPVEYSVSKNDSGVTAYIQYPSVFYKVAPGASNDYVESSIGFHTGDWHQGVNLYQKWLNTWYRPVNAQNKKWFTDMFLYKAVLLSDKCSSAINRTPPLYYDSATREYHIDEMIKVDKDYYDGFLPEMYSFGAWAYDEEHDVQRDGEYSTKDYDHVGGLDKLRTAIEKLQKKYGIAVATYTISDRYHKDTEFAKKYGDIGAQQRADGWIVNDPYTWYSCRCGDVWRDYIVNAIAKMSKETGVKAVYHDVLGTPGDGNALCWRKDHGHEIPSWNNKLDFNYVSAIRKAMPNQVFWTEYPVSDVTSQYTDGWISYDFITLYDYFARWYNTSETVSNKYAELSMNVIRYVFPKIKQFGFPVGVENGDWGVLKNLFFNGQGLHDATYWLYTSDGLKHLNKAHKIQKAYTDCFTSANPTTMVPTDIVGVYANKWPGKGRTVWTLYNTKYTTVRGQVISIEHKSGAAYFDVWNNKKLSPKIKNGMAVIDLKLYPQGLGCIAQNYSKWNVKH